MAMAGSTQLTPALARLSLISASQGVAAQVCVSVSGLPRIAVSSSLWGCKAQLLRKRCEGLSRVGSQLGTVSAVFSNEEIEESPEEITAAYEALYGKAFGGGKAVSFSSFESKDGEDEAPARSRRPRTTDSGRGPRGSNRGGMEERVVQIRRVTKVVKGGKQLSFRAIVVVGDKKGKVGVGVGKAKEVITAVQKSSLNAKRNIVNVPMTKYRTFPHRAEGIYGAAKVMLRPAATGTGVIAGGSVKVVLELAGVENALGKELGSKNPLNNARAVVQAISGMKQFADVAKDRGIPMEELWK